MNKHPIRIAWLLPSLCLGVVATTPLFAQQQGSIDEDVVVLSPFAVETSRDLGYLAQNSLSGSRLNTSLKDTSASISVMTKEFLSDIGATSMKDIILFSNNSVPEYGDSAPNYNGNPMVGNSEWLLRIRGLPASYARNYFESSTPTDFYNVDRIDQSRGPNSILFGFASAGGIVNTTTKQASLVPIDSELSFTVGSWDRTRTTLDHNQIFGDGKAALRVNAMYEDGNSWREYEYYGSKRIHLAGTYKIGKKSSIRFEFENGRVADSVARTWLLIDQAYAWRNAGSPTYDDAQWGSDIVSQTWSEHIVYIENDGSVRDWNGRPYSYSGSQSWSHLAMTDENLALYPVETNVAGLGAKRKTNYNNYSLWYEVSPVENLNIELAYNHQYSHFEGYDPNAGNMTRYAYLGDASGLFADASNWTPEVWTANEYAGQYYLENNWTRRTNRREVDNFRATASYKLDLGKAGNHRIAMMLGRTKDESLSVEESEVLLGSPFDYRAEFDSNRVFRRSYITQGDAASIRVPSWETPVSYTVPWSGVTYSSGWVPNQAIDNSDDTLDTAMLALQSFFFRDRLVTTLGVRHDRLDNSSLDTVRGADGVLRLDPDSRRSKVFNADTMSVGAVYHVTDAISLFANHSNTRKLPNLSQHLIGYDVPPMPEGVGSDIGVKLDLFGGKLYATINYYTTDFKNTTEWGNINASCTTLNNRVLEKLVSDGLISQSEADARHLDADAYLEDRKSDGWEFELVANPNENWRITANFSINNVKKSNIMSEVDAWAKEATAFWLSKAGGASYMLSAESWDVLGDNIGWMQDYIDGETAFNGRQARGERKYGSSLYVRYLFTNTVLKNLYIGGGARYQSANSVDYDGDTLIKGNDLTLFDFMAGYDFKLRGGDRPITASLQLNISNLLDNDDYQIYTVAWWNSSIPERIGLQEPRKFTLSAKVNF